MNKVISTVYREFPIVKLLLTIGFSIIVCMSLFNDLKISFGLLFLSALMLVSIQNYKIVLFILVLFTVCIETTLQQISLASGQSGMLNFNGAINIYIVAFTLLYIFKGEVKPFNSLITKPFLLYFLIVIFSLAVSSDRVLTIKSGIRISTGYCLYLLISQLITDKKSMDKMFKFFLFLCIIPIFVGLYQIVFVNKFHFTLDMRVTGTFKNGQSYSQYLAILLPFLFARLTSVNDFMGKKVFFFVLFILGLANLLYSNTRIGWVACFFSIIIYCYLSNKKRILLFLLVLLVMMGIALSPFVMQRFGIYFTTPWSAYLSDNLYDSKHSSVYEGISSVHARIWVWKNMLRETFKSPIIGLGSGTWFDYFSAKLGIGAASHNDYIEVLFGTGFLGLFFYFLLRIKQIGLLMKIKKFTLKSPENMTVILPSLAISISLMVVSLTEVWQAYVGVYWTFWIILGLSECYYKYFLKKSTRYDKL